MKNALSKAISGSIIFVVLCFLPAFFVFKLWYDHGLQYPHSITDFEATGDYKIDSESILADLSQNKTSVFESVVDDDEENRPDANDMFSWSQSDYLTVANALHEVVWGETLDGWKIFSMKFYRGCQNDPVGFGFADITYFRLNNEEGGYEIHEMTMDPNSGKVSWGGADNWPRPLFGWRSINSYLFRVTADEALQIAEESGGKEFRREHKNECNIMLILKPNPTNRRDWVVYYDYQGSLITFEVLINPYTGWH